MAQKSPYPRIVLMKSFNSDCNAQLKTQLGKYTHIQSFNGILLDGLNIDTATTIIQKSSHLSKIQLVVRYIHPIKSDTLSGGLAGGLEKFNVVTPIFSPVTRELMTLPIPLMILGDSPRLYRELFRNLSKPLDDSRCMSRPVSSDSGRLQNHASTPTPPEPSRLQIPYAKSDTSGSGCDSYDEVDFSNDYSALSQSDKYVSRALVPHNLFCKCNNGSSGGSAVTTLSLPFPAAAVPPSYQQYIVSMFTQGMDRRLVHLFLRQSGIYIITVSLKYMIEDPQIQFENLSYWIRLVQGCVEPRGIKRIIIVVMKDILKENVACMDNLKHAIREADYENLYEHHGSPIILFDRDMVRSSLDNLCCAISRCMELMMMRAWYMNKTFFKMVFEPFAALNMVLCHLSSSPAITMSSDAVLSIYKNTHSHYFENLAAFSNAAISLTQNRKLSEAILCICKDVHVCCA